MKTLVLGGYGNFGARICRALAQDAGVELIVGGRDLDRATAFAQSLGGTARGVRIDVQSADLARAIRDADAGAELVIHTAGPFQNQDYRVPHAVRWPARTTSILLKADASSAIFPRRSTPSSAMRAARPAGKASAASTSASRRRARRWHRCTRRGRTPRLAHRRRR